MPLLVDLRFIKCYATEEASCTVYLVSWRGRSDSPLGMGWMKECYEVMI